MFLDVFTIWTTGGRVKTGRIADRGISSAALGPIHFSDAERLW